MARSVSVKLLLEMAGVEKVKEGAQAVRGLSEELRNAKADNLNEIANAAGGMGLALAAGFGAAVGAAAAFDKQMSQVRAVSDASAAQMDQLREAALQAGKDTAYSATQAAKAQEELAKAGISTADILGGALSGALSLAAAGSLELAEAADISAKTMNIFKLQGKDVGHIADVLASAANKSATDVHEMGEALRMGGMVAAQFGLSLEDTVGTLSMFAQRALVGSDAGTSLKTMLQMLANPSKESAELMDKLGISAFDAAGNFVGMARLSQNLQDSLKGLTQEQRTAALAQIFGADAIRAATVLYDEGAAGVKKFTEAVNDQGAAAETARIKTDNLAGDLERLKGSLQTLAIEAGSGANEGLRTLTQAADNVVGAFSALPAPVQQGGIVLAGIAGAGLLASAGLIKARNASREALEALSEIGPRGEKAAKGLEAAGRGATRAAIAIAAVQTVSALLADNLNPQVEGMAVSLEKYGASGAKAGEATRVLGDDFKHLSYDLGTLNSGFWSDLGNGVSGFIEGVTGLGGVMDESLQHAKERLGAVDAALAQLVQSGKAEEAQAAFARIAEEAKKQGVSIDELKNGLPQYVTAMDQAKQSTDLAGQAQASAAAQTKMMSGSLEDAIREAGGLASALDQLNGKATGFANAEITAEAAIDSLSESLKENGRTLDVNTEQGRNNKQALLDGVEAAKKAAQAKLDETGSVEQASATYNGYIDRLKQTLRQAGFTEAEVDKLIATYGRIPPLKSTTITTDGLDTAHNKVKQYIGTIDGIPRYRSTVVEIIPRGGAPAVASVRRWGGIDYHMASGGALDAHFATAPTVLYGERETGGEAFVPRLGDYHRSMAILSKAAGWYGAQVVPGGRMGGGVATRVTNLNLTVNAGLGVNGQQVGAQIVAELRRYEQDNGTGWRTTGG